MTDCPFCSIEPPQIIWSDELVIVIRDAWPVSPSHSLVIPRRHFESIFEATPDELRSLAKAIVARKEQLALTLTVNAYNIGINEGRAAGQLVPHAHIHIIPRFDRDVPDPRGGVRGVIPERRLSGMLDEEEREN
jgi:diadenosine tetraphosphate (Ap4A) HIT family hydrolase